MHANVLRRSLLRNMPKNDTRHIAQKDASKLVRKFGSESKYGQEFPERISVENSKSYILLAVIPVKIVVKLKL